MPVLGSLKLLAVIFGIAVLVLVTATPVPFVLTSFRSR
jgi:hypothetical protein